jgi:tRNA pseudouridine38-40 synthase
MSEQTIKLTIEYDGTSYSGWQVQNAQTTIQGEINRALKELTGQTITVHGAGRTDAGVHALAQVGSFVIDHNIEPSKYAAGLNHYLNDDIRILKSEPVASGFHARKSAQSKIYRYMLSDRRSALYWNRRWEYSEALDFGLLTQAAGMVIGEHDFEPFCVVKSRKEDNCCRIASSEWRQDGENLIYEISGDRFLHNMVRSLVGAMVNLSRLEPDRNPANLTLADFEDILNSQTDSRIPFTAPPQGLYLVSVQY